MDCKHKIQRADHIIDTLKDELMFILWDTSPNEYGSFRSLFPWVEEETEYLIKALGLKKDDEERYIEKVHQVMGEYSELIPLLKKRRL
ncbi:MAG: hypothetical protein U9R60_09300 [Bacteroidota bacterium]|nr:hypothetical protein [Bacteroidota bacterium]